MTNIEEAQSWIGRTAVDSTGAQIGRITQIWVDDQSGQAEWASLKGAILGRQEVVAPLDGVASVRSARQFAFSKEQLIGAPKVGQEGRLELQDKESLLSYYGMARSRPAAAPPAGWSERTAEAAPPPPQSDPSAEAAPPPPGWSDPSADAAPPAGGADLSEAWMQPATEAPQPKRRFRRKASAPEQQPKGRFRRKSSAPEQQPVDSPA